MGVDVGLLHAIVHVSLGAGMRHRGNWVRVWCLVRAASGTNDDDQHGNTTATFCFSGNTPVFVTIVVTTPKEAAREEVRVTAVAAPLATVADASSPATTADPTP